jgi:hypothetical protein
MHPSGAAYLETLRNRIERQLRMRGKRHELDLEYAQELVGNLARMHQAGTDGGALLTLARIDELVRPIESLNAPRNRQGRPGLRTNSSHSACMQEQPSIASTDEPATLAANANTRS